MMSQRSDRQRLRDMRRTRPMRMPFWAKQSIVHVPKTKFSALCVRGEPLWKSSLAVLASRVNLCGSLAGLPTKLLCMLWDLLCDDAHSATVGWCTISLFASASAGQLGVALRLDGWSLPADWSTPLKSNISWLASLSLEDCRLDNSVATELLRLTTLKTLNLRRNPNVDNTFARLLTLPRRVDPQTERCLTKLVSLDVSETGISPDALRLLHTLPMLTWVCISGRHSQGPLSTVVDAPVLQNEPVQPWDMSDAVARLLEAKPARLQFGGLTRPKARAEDTWFRVEPRGSSAVAGQKIKAKTNSGDKGAELIDSIFGPPPAKRHAPTTL